ncbi:MAG: Zn-dependent hydrolase [Halolamina sp.]|uniref:Zn-dependent hydrolase n=1 Tax=Halolamina sp. TaxID=1940283 RepID=UPI002FC3CD3C
MVTIDRERFRESFENYSRIGATANGGLHRLTLTEADKRARDTFVDDLEALGLDVRIDRIGNIFGRRDGTDPTADPVLIGSHLDSQPYGGRFDGQLGVLASLETLRGLDDEGVETERPIEIVNWTNEEGSRFQNALLGSSVFAGNTELETALGLTDDEGTTVEEALGEIGYDGDHPAGPSDIHAHIELHIEQGPSLEAHGNTLGIVEGVYGMSWLRATITGDSDHAGPTPMHTRSDAMATAADAVSEINRLPNRLSADAVSTVGEFTIGPGSINVVPDTAEFTVDVRSDDDSVVAEAVTRVKQEVEHACSRHSTTASVEDVWSIESTAFDDSVCDVIESVADDQGIAHERMPSGAAHDAKHLNDIAPTAMLFAPSVDGKTHNEAELTEWDDCVRTANCYAAVTVELATQ